MKSNQQPIILLAFANDNEDQALYLRNLIFERNQIEEALEPVHEKICRVIVMSNVSVNKIFNAFQKYKNQIAIFHYGGHAGGDTLMLEDKWGNHGYANSAGLAPFLAKQQGLKLVFLNGCASQEQSIEMMELGVPMVIGTSMAIRDDIATEFSTRFYLGLANGLSIDQAWKAAIDIIKTKNEGTKQRKGLKLRRDKSSEYPWRRFIKEGAEEVKNWNLPMAAKSPLFGLPDLPATHLPEKPFVFLRPYSEDYASLFFGRGSDIRMLYNRVTDDKGAPVLLFYGQSGAGKSSLLDAGLLPRLKNRQDGNYEVIYLRRDAKKGLLATLDNVWRTSDFVPFHEQKPIDILPKNNDLQEQLEQIETLMQTAGIKVYGFLEQAKESLEAQIKAFQQENKTSTAQQKKEKTRRAAWIAKEKKAGKPLLVIIDQVEEVFTRGTIQEKGKFDELTSFLMEIKGIFNDSRHRPEGKIILAYRKEYQPEIEELCKKLEIPREALFLKHLDTENVMEIVNGLEATPALQAKYKVKVENELPRVIADDLLEDKKSAIAPTLQILLSKMWDLEVEKFDNRHFSISNYQTLRKQGLLMHDFYHQQLDKLKANHPDWVNSGLILDILHFHVTSAGTSGIRNIDEIKERYQHIPNIAKIIQHLKDLYLLAAINQGVTCLAHDTLAPVINHAFNVSVLPGQLATRILNNKQLDLKDTDAYLDKHDLVRVQEGKNGMRCLSNDEKDFVQRSIEENEKREKELEEKNKALEAALAKAELKAKESEANRLSSLASTVLNTDKNHHQAMIIAYKALKTSITRTSFLTFYKTIFWKEGETRYHIVRRFKGVELFHEFPTADKILLNQGSNLWIVKTDGSVVAEIPLPQQVLDFGNSLNTNYENINTSNGNLFFSKKGQYFAILIDEHLWIWNNKGQQIAHVEDDFRLNYAFVGFTDNEKYFQILTQNNVNYIYTIKGKLHLKLPFIDQEETVDFNDIYLVNWLKSQKKNIKKLEKAGIPIIFISINRNQAIGLFPQAKFMFTEEKEDEYLHTFWDYSGAKIIESAEIVSKNFHIISTDDAVFAINPNRIVKLTGFPLNNYLELFPISESGKYFGVNNEINGENYFYLFDTTSGKLLCQIKMSASMDVSFYEELQLLTVGNQIYNFEGQHIGQSTDTEINALINDKLLITRNAIQNHSGTTLTHFTQNEELFLFNEQQLFTYERFQDQLDIVELSPMPILQPYKAKGGSYYNMGKEKFWMSDNDQWYAHFFDEQLKIGQLPQRSVDFNFELNNVEKCVFSPNSKYVYLDKNSPFLLNLETGEQLSVTFSVLSYTESILFNAHSDRLLLVENDEILIWDVENDIQKRIPNDTSYEIAWHPNGKEFLMSKNKSQFKLAPQIWNVEDVNQAKSIIFKEDILRYSPSGKYLIVGNDTEFLELRTHQNQLVKRFEPVMSVWEGFQFSNDETYLLVEQSDGYDITCLLYDIENDETTELQAENIHYIAFSPQSNYLINHVSENDNSYIQHLTTQERIEIGNFSTIFSPDESMLFCTKYGRDGYSTENSIILDPKGNLLFDFTKHFEIGFSIDDVEFNPSLPYIKCNQHLLNLQFQPLQFFTYFTYYEFSKTGKYVVYKGNFKGTALVPLPETFFGILENSGLLELEEEIQKFYGI